MATERTWEGGRVLATSVIPWTDDLRFDAERFQAQVSRQLGAGLTDLYVFGTAGEGHAVTESQFSEIVEVFVAAMRAGGAEPMVGIISLSLGTMVERIEAAQALGVRRFQVAMPSWGALNDQELEAFFEEVLGSFRDAEFLHYNVARARRQLTGAEYGRLARRHPNLVATKQSGDSMRQIASSLEEAPRLRHYLVDGGYAYGSLLRDCGLLPSLALCNPERLFEYAAAGPRRDVDELLAAQRDLAHLAGGLREVVGPVPLIDGAYDKVIWRLHDPEFAGRMLPPYQAAPEDSAERFRAWIEEHVPRWTPPQHG